MALSCFITTCVLFLFPPRNLTIPRNKQKSKTHLPKISCFRSLRTSNKVDRAELANGNVFVFSWPPIRPKDPRRNYVFRKVFKESGLGWGIGQSGAGANSFKPSWNVACTGDRRNGTAGFSPFGCLLGLRNLMILASPLSSALMSGCRATDKLVQTGGKVHNCPTIRWRPILPD